VSFEAAWEKAQVKDLVAEEDQLRAHEDEVRLRTTIPHNPFFKNHAFPQIHPLSRVMFRAVPGDFGQNTPFSVTSGAVLGDFGQNTQFSTSSLWNRVMRYTPNQ
jgi:hypothetical protein